MASGADNNLVKINFDADDDKEVQHSIRKVPYKWFHNRPLNAIFIILLLLVLIASTSIFLGVLVENYYVLFRCSGAEFLIVLALFLIIVGFVITFFFQVLANLWSRKRQYEKHIDDIIEKEQEQQTVDKTIEKELDDTELNKAFDIDEDREEGVLAAAARAAAQTNTNSNTQAAKKPEPKPKQNDARKNRAKISAELRVHLFRCCKIICFILGIVSFLLLIAVSIFMLVIQNISAPQYSGELTLRGLEGKVTIQREPEGLIHILASNDHDLFFAQGVISAQERLWQMEMNRRIGQGRLSEVVGAAGRETDKFTRTIGFYRAAKQDIKALTNESLSHVQAYCDGINAYLATSPNLPMEFRLLSHKNIEPWKAEDVLVWLKMMAWDLSGNMKEEQVRLNLLKAGISIDRINELMPDYPRNATTAIQREDLGINLSAEDIEQIEQRLSYDSPDKIYMPSSSPSSLQSFQIPKTFYGGKSSLLGAFGGTDASNNWVVSGAFSKTGKPILCNDPHLRLTAPGIWYSVHLSSPTTDVIGVSLPGVPGVIIGRNKNVAWGMTNVGADNQDMYANKENEDSSKYEYKGSWLDFESRTETILVKDDTETVLTVKDTVHGPVTGLSVDNTGSTLIKNAISLKWSPLEGVDGTMNSVFQVMKANNYKEYVDALEHYVAPAQNFIFADVAGNIGYVMPGRIPIRAEGHSGKFVANGDGSADWLGYIPYSQLPRVFNPAAGYIVTANNRIPPLGYNFTITHDWEPPFRAERIQELIVTKEKVDVEDMKDIQMDVKSRFFESLRFIFTTTTKGLLSGELESWREKLAQWDGVQSIDSQESTVFEMFYYEITKLIQTETHQIWKNRLYIRDLFANSGTPKSEQACQKNQQMSCDKLATTALRNAVNTLRTKYGNFVPRWSTVHTVEFDHLVLSSTGLKCMASRSIAAPGGTETVNVAPIAVYGDSLTTRHGPSYRQILDLSADRNDQYVLPLGQSGNWFSTLYDNMMTAWRDGKYYKLSTKDYTVGFLLTLQN